MDRRRFVPKPEGLEGRSLLSTIFNNSSNASNNPATDVPVTFDQKMTRIAHLPYYLENLQPGRYMSADLMKNLQADLTEVAGTLHRPNPQTLENFNDLMRTIMPHTTLRQSDTVALNKAFTSILTTTGATPDQVNSISQDMVQLAQIDSQSRQPVYLATNDYAIVIQTILGIGHPIQRPNQPSIALSSGSRADQNLGISKYHRPTLVGSYGVGNTVGVYSGDLSGGFNSNGVTIEIINSNGEVIGQSQVDSANGDYRVTVNTPLPNGVYKFWARAVDSAGHESNLSPPYAIRVASREPLTSMSTGQSVPRGPMAVR
ncbi:hypothetical protein [Singulisphaera sp. PoT]|uniref:hypothetical protein n=1 Tax=Singulisphaera sp. PoT TaxID=3411797 RepID=UPI003BF49D37